MRIQINPGHFPNLRLGSGLGSNINLGTVNILYVFSEVWKSPRTLVRESHKIRSSAFSCYVSMLTSECGALYFFVK